MYNACLKLLESFNIRPSTIAGLDWTGLDSSGLNWKRSSATQTTIALDWVGKEGYIQTNVTV